MSDICVLRLVLQKDILILWATLLSRSSRASLAFSSVCFASATRIWTRLICCGRGIGCVYVSGGERSVCGGAVDWTANEYNQPKRAQAHKQEADSVGPVPKIPFWLSVALQVIWDGIAGKWNRDRHCTFCASVCMEIFAWCVLTDRYVYMDYIVYIIHVHIGLCMSHCPLALEHSHMELFSDPCCAECFALFAASSASLVSDKRARALLRPSRTCARCILDSSYDIDTRVHLDMGTYFSRLAISVSIRDSYRPP